MKEIMIAIVSASFGGCIGALTLALFVGARKRNIPANRRLIDAAEFRKRLMARYKELSDNAKTSYDHVVAGAAYGTITLLDQYVEEVYGSLLHGLGRTDEHREYEN